jgi:hypothetical protein
VIRDQHHDDARTLEGIEAFINGPTPARGRRGDDPAARRPPAVRRTDDETWRDALTLEEARVARYDRPAAAVALDVTVRGADPDRLVEPVAEAILREARDTDRLAWAGGGRFHVLLVETTHRDAARFAERAGVAARAVASWVAGPRADADVRVGICGTAPGRGVLLALRLAERELDAQEADDDAGTRPASADPRPAGGPAVPADGGSDGADGADRWLIDAIETDPALMAELGEPLPPLDRPSEHLPMTDLSPGA